MNSTHRLILVAALAIVAVIIGQEVRFNMKLAVLRAELAERTAADAATSADNESTEESVRQISRAREELALAQQRLSSAAGKIQRLESQVETLRQQLQGGSIERLGPRRRTESEVLTLQTFDPAQPQRRSWGHEQAVGAPDTMTAGDHSTAWAPRQQDAGEEWLHLDYSNTVSLAEVRVRETYNPGAISKVTAVLASGQEVAIWEGVDEAGVAPVEKSFAVPGNLTAKSVKVYLDTRRVPGWNEIDAVELVGRDGSRQWASQASASSSYADPR